MDPKLAEIYGTNQQNEADLEKLAAAELAEGLANDDQLDTDGLSEDELEAVAQDVLNASGEESNEEVEQEKTSAAEEAQEKLAEADYLGRVMAHAYVKELRDIEGSMEKEAGMTSGARAMQSAKGTAGKAAGKVGGFLSKVKDVATGKQAREGFSAASKSKATGNAAKAMGEKSVMSPKGKERAGAMAAKHLGEGKEHMKSGLKGMAKTVGLYGGAAATAYGAKKALEKKSSALETLVEARAMEILQASGIDPNELTETEGQEKVSDPREALAGAVEERAWALLGQYGVVPSEQTEESAEGSAEE
jgi:hypothetical protein